MCENFCENIEKMDIDEISKEENDEEMEDEETSDSDEGEEVGDDEDFNQEEKVSKEESKAYLPEQGLFFVFGNSVKMQAN